MIQTLSTTVEGASSLGTRNQLYKSTIANLRAVRLVKPDSLSDKDILTCESYRFYAQDLSAALLEDVAKLYPNHYITLSNINFKHYDLEGHFDQVVCRLVQGSNSTYFDVNTSFFFDNALVTIAEQSAYLVN